MRPLFTVASDLLDIRRRALTRTRPRVAAVDYTTDPPTVALQINPGDPSTVTVALPRHVAVAEFDHVDYEASQAARGQVRGTVTGGGGWADCELAGSWTALGGGHPTLRWRVEPGHVVRLHGAVTGGSGTITTLPAVVRPAQPSRFPAVGNAAFAVVQVDTGGVVSLVSGSATGLYVDGAAPL